MIKELKRVENGEIEFRLVKKRQVIKVYEKTFTSLYIIQARSKEQFRFQNFFIQHSKKEGIRMLTNQKELEMLSITFKAAKDATKVVNKII